MLFMIRVEITKILEILISLEILPPLVVTLGHGETLRITHLIFETPKGGSTFLWDLGKSSPSHLDNPFIQVMKGKLTFVVFISGCIIIPADVEN